MTAEKIVGPLFVQCLLQWSFIMLWSTKRRSMFYRVGAWVIQFFLKRKGNRSNCVSVILKQGLFLLIEEYLGLSYHKLWWNSLFFKGPIKKINLYLKRQPWQVWLSWLGIVPQSKRLPVWFLIRDAPQPRVRHVQGSWLMFLSYSPSLPLSLKINKYKI